MLGLLTGGLSKYLMIGMAAVLLIGGGLSYWYYKDSQATIYTLNQNIATLEANAVALEGAIDTLNGTVLTLEKQRKIDQVKIDKLSAEYRDSREKVNDLRRTLSKHDIGYLAQEKPGLIENIINKGTKKVGKTLESLSQPTEISHE